MNKIIAWLCILITLYIVSVFVIPESADKLAKQFWIESFNTSIRSLKKTVDTTIKIPEATGRILDIYQSTYDEARQVKDTYNKAIEQWTQIKQKIDTVRATLSWAEDTVNKTVDTANTMIETGKEIQGKIWEIQKSVNDVNKLGNSIKWLVNTGAIK